MSNEFCFHLKLRQADRMLTSYYDAFLRDIGLKITQFSILRCLWFHQSPSHKELEELLVLNQTTLTRNLKSLLKAGYVISTPSETDQRVKLLNLSEKGKALYLQAMERWQLAQKNVSEQLGDSLSSHLFNVSDSLQILNPEDASAVP